MDKLALILVIGLAFAIIGLLIGYYENEKRKKTEKDECSIILDYKSGYDCALEWIRTGSDPYQLAQKAIKEDNHTSNWKKGWNQACLDEIDYINSEENDV